MDRLTRMWEGSKTKPGYAQVCRASGRAHGEDGQRFSPNLPKFNLKTTAMSKFIVFNTQKQAQHWVKHRNKVLRDQHYERDPEVFSHYAILCDNKVGYVSGWRCGCGCDMGSTHVAIVGRYKRA